MRYCQEYTFLVFPNQICSICLRKFTRVFLSFKIALLISHIKYVVKTNILILRYKCCFIWKIFHFKNYHKNVILFYAIINASHKPAEINLVENFIRDNFFFYCFIRCIYFLRCFILAEFKSRKEKN